MLKYIQQSKKIMKKVFYRFYSMIQMLNVKCVFHVQGGVSQTQKTPFFGSFLLV